MIAGLSRLSMPANLRSGENMAERWSDGVLKQWNDENDGVLGIDHRYSNTPVLHSLIIGGDDA